MFTNTSVGSWLSSERVKPDIERERLKQEGCDKGTVHKMKWRRGG